MQDTPYHLSVIDIEDEKQQILNAQADIHAFGVLYEKYYDRILGFVYQRVETKEIASDVTSQVFFNALRKIGTFTFKGIPFSAWLYRIAINEISGLFRKEKIRRTISIEEHSLDGIYDELKEDRQEELDKRLMSALKTLPEDELNIIEMKYFESMKFSEIAEIISMSESAVKMKMYRALEKIKSKLV